MHLSDEELRAVLTRAAEIQQATRPGGAELEKVIGKAEAAGYSRAAVERALRERFGAQAPPEVGQMCFALSTDGKYYPARVLANTQQGSRVRFLVGTENDVAPDQIRPFLQPGERVWVDWPWWGPWMCTVVSYDSSAGKVKLSDRWGTLKQFPIAEVWIEPPKQGAGIGGFGVYISAWAAGAAMGGIAGALITMLLMR